MPYIKNDILSLLPNLKTAQIARYSHLHFTVLNIGILFLKFYFQTQTVYILYKVS